MIPVGMAVIPDAVLAAVPVTITVPSSLVATMVPIAAVGSLQCLVASQRAAVMAAEVGAPAHFPAVGCR